MMCSNNIKVYVLTLFIASSLASRLQVALPCFWEIMKKLQNYIYLQTFYGLYLFGYYFFINSRRNNFSVKPFNPGGVLGSQKSMLGV